MGQDTQPPCDEYLDLDAVAKRWKTSRSTPYRMIVSGKLPAYNFGSGKKRASWRVRLSDLEEYERQLRSLPFPAGSPREVT